MSGQVSGLYLLDLASRNAEWLATRQALVAGNIANANTPAYKARDVRPFASVLASTSLDLAATNSAHLSTAIGGARSVESRPEEPWAVTASGNSVSLEKEMIAAGEVNRGFALNTSVVKAFHRLLMASVKS